MNYVCPSTTPCCISCGRELPFELDLADATGLACDSCFRESEAAMAKARQSEADSDFRWMSREWFKSSHLERQPFMTRNHFGGL